MAPIDVSERGTDLATHEHATGGLHGHLNLNRNFAPFGGHGPSTRDHRRLHLQEIHRRLDQEEIDAAHEKATRLLHVGISQFGEADVAETRQLGARTDRAGHVPRTTIGFVLVGDLAGEARRGDVEVVGALGNAVFGEDRGETAEARRFEGVDTGVEERGVHAPDHVGTRETQHLVATLEAGSAEIVGPEVETLDEGPESAVEHDDSFVDGGEIRLTRHRTKRYL